MNEKNNIKVIINDKPYTLSGYESEEYLQKIALFLNSKYAELSKEAGYRHLDDNQKNLTMQINIVDEYYKMVERNEDLEKELEKKDKELFELKHELISKKEDERGKKHNSR
ncbi:MAG: cell division protein ZapA [Catonella sp.]|uniref:cell division protein ZapA n=1 Tax=Catonella sp. TaxID=2382125 RepID=UPI003FA185D1